MAPRETPNDIGVTEWQGQGADGIMPRATSQWWGAGCARVCIRAAQCLCAVSDFSSELEINLALRRDFWAVSLDLTGALAQV